MLRTVPPKLSLASLHALQSRCQVIERSDEQEENPLFTIIGPGGPVSLDRGGMARSFHVAIAIASMNRSTEAIADPLYSALFRSDIKRSTCPDQNPSNVDALVGATGDDCSDDIPRLQALDLLCSFGL